MSLFRNFKIRETQTIQFRWETFNVFNHPEFAPPVGVLTSALFGQSISTITAAGGFTSNRQMQFALRYMF